MMQRIDQVHECFMAITRRPVNIVSSDRVVLSVGGRSLWMQLSEETTDRVTFLLDGGITLFLDAIVITELGAVGFPQKVALQPPLLCVNAGEVLLDVSRPPDSSDLRVRGVQSVGELEQKVREHLREIEMRTALQYLRYLESERIGLGFFGTSSSDEQVMLTTRDDCLRFATRNLVFETSPDYDIFFDDTSLLFRDRTAGFLINELGSFVMRGKDAETVKP
jgi:hypothetical protein